jgi:U3 small nucleolar RNA-associated protein 6
MLRRKRKKRAQFVGPKSATDYSIVQHVHQLFQLATNRFKGDLKLWLQYAHYCEKMGSHRQLSQVYGHALQYHPHDAGLWISAAKTEFEVNKNVVAARNVLLKALKNNPGMKQLWHEYFRLELLYVDKLFKRREILGVQLSETDLEEVSDVILQYKVASIVFHQAIETITGDVNFCLQFLPISQLFERSEQLQDEIYTCLMEHHCDSEDARDALSRRPLSDYLYSVEKGSAINSGRECKFARKKCRSLYRAAVNDMPTVRMWDFFLSFLLEWCKQKMSSKATTRVYEELLKAMNEAAVLNCLSPLMWCHRIEVSLRMGHSDSALIYSVDAVHNHSDSFELWVKCLQLHCALKEDYSDIEKLFLQAVDDIRGKNSIQLWVMWCEYCQSAYPDKVEAVFEVHKHEGF